MFIFGFIEIEKWYPIGGHITSEGTKEYLEANFPGKKILWAIEQMDIGKRQERH